jgi:hypothetical protein
MTSQSAHLWQYVAEELDQLDVCRCCLAPPKRLLFNEAEKAMHHRAHNACFHAYSIPSTASQAVANLVRKQLWNQPRYIS